MKESFFLTLLFLIIIVLLTVSETLSHNFSKDIILYDKKNICFELFQGLNTLVNCLNLKELKQKEKLMIENDFDLLFKNLESNLINNDQIRLKLRNSVIEIYDENLQMDKFFLNKYDFLNLIKALISISLKKISLVRFNIIISFKQIFLKLEFILNIG